MDRLKSGLRPIAFHLVSLLCGLCGAVAAWSAPSEQVPVGPRAIAMGGAYSSLALDASALFWNPAGIAWIGHQEIAGTYANLFQSDIKDNYVGFVLPISRKTAVGADWYHSGFEDSELHFGENRFDLALSTQLERRLSVGLTTKLLTRDTDLDGSAVARGSGFGLDLGALAIPVPGLRIGAVAQDLFGTEVRESGGSGSVAYPRNVRVGASYDFANRLTLAFDVDDRWHAGAEFRALDLLAIRAGLEKDREGPEAATFTTGAGVRYGIFRFDYAYVVPPTLSSTSHFGLSLAFNFNPAQVRIEKIETKDLFASQYKSYARVPIGHADVRNLSNKLLEGRLRVEIDGYMTEATERDLNLSPGAATRVDLFANLNDEPMTMRENARLPVRVSATYTSDRLVRTDKLNSSVVMYAPGAIDWNLGLDQTAAFITTQDPVVSAVATQAVRAVTDATAASFASPNVAHAAAIFDALSTMGVTYVQDPNDPYPTISDRAGAVDRVNYPRQTLAKRSGDCDDTTVLMAALLQSVGISTKLVDVPAHLFLLFDTGMHERDVTGLDDGLFVTVDQGLWIPLETTALKKGFAEAWRSGAETHAAAAANRTVALVDVQEAKARFESSLPPGDAPAVAIDPAALAARLAADAGVLDAWSARYHDTHFKGVEDHTPPSRDALDELARENYLGGRIDEALRLLGGEASRSARTLNNRGNVLAAAGDVAGALASYREAGAVDPDDAGIWLNRGLVSSVAGDSAAAEEALARGLEKSGGYEEACRLLGLRPEASDDRGAPSRVTKAQLRRLLRSTLQRIPPGDSLRTGSSPGRPRPRLKAITGAPRGEFEPEDVRVHLYWRERE
jgi:hypothetical protein